MGDKTTFLCEICNKEVKIPKNVVNKPNALEKAKEKHNHKAHSLILGIKFKIYPQNSDHIQKLNEYFSEYAKAVNFASKIINKLKSPFVQVGRFNKETKKMEYPKDKCDYCEKESFITHKGCDGKKICKACYQEKFSENNMRKIMYATKGRKVKPSFNILNATNKLSKTHYHYAIRDAFQLLKANERQRKQRLKYLLKQKKRLKEFEEIIKDTNKRYELPMKPHQREKRYIHISQKEKANELRGYTLKKVQDKIKILRRNIEKIEKSLRKKSPLNFKGNRIMISPQGIKFDKLNNKIKISIKKKEIPEEYGFSGTNVANKHGRKFFEEKLNDISKQKPKYAYLIRKQINQDKNNPIFDYYLQYTVESLPTIKKEYNGVIGIDRGSNPNLAVLVLLEKNKDKPSFVKFIKGKDIIALKIRKRKQLYFLKNKHNKRKKQKKIREIAPKIKQILHTASKEIVNIAKEKNAAIALEQLEKIGKSKFRQSKIEKFRFSLFNFKILSTFIDYKAKREGIKVIYVPPERTSQNCSHCAMKGNIHSDTRRPYQKPNAKKPSYTLFKCNVCGVELNADYNAAFNIAQKALKTLSS